MFYYLNKIHCTIASTSCDIGNMCIAIVCFSGYDAIYFEIKLSF